MGVACFVSVVRTMDESNGPAQVAVPCCRCTACRDSRRPHPCPSCSRPKRRQQRLPWRQRLRWPMWPLTYDWRLRRCGPRCRGCHLAPSFERPAPDCAPFFQRPQPLRQSLWSVNAMRCSACECACARARKSEKRTNGDHPHAQPSMRAQQPNDEHDQTCLLYTSPSPRDRG